MDAHKMFGERLNLQTSVKHLTDPFPKFFTKKKFPYMKVVSILVTFVPPLSDCMDLSHL